MATGKGEGQARWIALRIALVALLFASGSVAVAARAVRLQILQGPQLARHGDGQWRRFVELRPRRGLIKDRNGETLAASADAPSIAASPSALQHLSRGEARALARALALDPGTLARKAQREGHFVWLKRRVAPDEARAVEDLGLEGVGVFLEPRRYYTSKNLAAQLVGFVGDDGEGLEGIERAYDDALQGGSVRLPSLLDARGRAVLDEAPAADSQAVLSGATVELALDVGLQLAAEQALGRAVREAHAAGGMLVAMDPRTGEVLALAHAPTFNPNLPRSGNLLRDKAVLDTFEPGSTFKLFTVAGALDAGVLRPDDRFDCGQGAYPVGGNVIHDHKAVGWATPARILAESSNIGAAKIAARLGRDRLQKTLLAFGFGEKSGTELPGEPRGMVPLPRSEIALATMAFGQGVAATPLQITSAVSAIANGGMLYRPILVRRVVDATTGAILAENDPTPVRRAVSRASASLITQWMEGVVDGPDGTGRRAHLDGWRVAGKTGTAQKADPVTRRYSVDKRFSSFVGFAPAEAPRIALGVFIDEPRGDVYGGEVAAPVFREVAEYALKSLGVRPTEAEAAPPPAEPAAALAEAPGAPAIDDDPPSRSAPAGEVAVPALQGLPARFALRELEALALAGEIQGSGRVAAQAPRPGEVVERGTRVRLVLAPRR